MGTPETDPFAGASPLRMVVLTVRFLTELGLLAAVAIGFWNLFSGGWRVLVAALSVVVVALIWGLLLSPKAPVRLPGFWKLLIEALLFAAAGALLLATGFGIAAALLFGIWLLVRIGMAVS